MSSDTRAWIGTVLRVALAGILFWAGLAKLADLEKSRQAISAYRLLPASWLDFMSVALPAFEIALAILLLIGLFTRWAALGTAVLMIAFIIGISSVWIRGYSIDCGCFGGGGEVGEEGKTWRYTSELLRDFLFTGMAVWLVAWPRTKLSVDGATMRAPITDLYDDEDDDIDDDTTDAMTTTLEEPTR